MTVVRNVVRDVTTPVVVSVFGGDTELLENGEFTSNIVGWGPAAGVSPTAVWNAGNMDVTTDGVLGYSQLVSGLTVGIEYTLEVDIATGSPVGRVYVNDTNNGTSPEENYGFVPAGSNSYDFTAAHASTYIVLGSNAADQTVEYERVSLKKK